MHYSRRECELQVYLIQYELTRLLGQVAPVTTHEIKTLGLQEHPVVRMRSWAGAFCES